MRVWIRVLVLVFAVFALAGPVFAQQEAVEPIDMSKIQKIPDYGKELSVDEFYANSELYEEAPPGDKYLAYRVRLPKGWNKAPSSIAVAHNKDAVEKADLSQRILGQISKFYGPGRVEALSRFEVEAQSLDYEVTAKNWLMQEILTRGYVLEGLKVLSDRRVEALYVAVEGDTAYVVRTAAEINGPRMVVASYFVPDRFFAQERAYQQRVIESFSFLSPEKSKIEMTKTYAFLDLLQFDYPASWRLVAPEVYNIEGMEASLINTVDGQTSAGEIHMSILSTEFPTAVPDEIKYLKEELKTRKLELGKLLETKTNYKLPPQVKYNYTEIYEANNPSANIIEHEFWISVMEEDRYYYVVTMLTPARASEFYTWARNSEAFQTIVESFKE